MAIGVGLWATLLGFPSIASAQQALSLKANVTDGDGTVTVGDVFDNAGPLANVVVGHRAGATAVLNAATVQSIVGANGGYWANPRGVHSIIVRAGSDAAPQVATQAPAGPVDPFQTAATGQVPASAPVQMASAQPAVPQAKAGQTVDALVFAHAMNTGDIVTADDVQFQPVLALAAAGNVPSSPQAAIGKAMRFPVRGGVVVRMDDLNAPVVVHKNEAIDVTWSSNALSLTIEGQAQKDGAAGDLIQVLNPTSKQMIDAVIVGPGQAIAGPAADHMRAPIQLSAR